MTDAKLKAEIEQAKRQIEEATKRAAELLQKAQETRGGAVQTGMPYRPLSPKQNALLARVRRCGREGMTWAEAEKLDWRVVGGLLARRKLEWFPASDGVRLRVHRVRKSKYLPELE